MLAQSITTRTFGFVTIALGLLGFFDNPLVGEDGVFQVNTLHNIVHLLTGAIALLVGYASPIGRREHQCRNYNLTFGWIYAAVFVLGIFGLTDGILNAGMADHVLHALFAVTLLGVGYAARTSEPRRVSHV